MNDNLIAIAKNLTLSALGALNGEFFANEFDGCISKPFDIWTLPKIIKSYLKEKKSP